MSSANNNIWISASDGNLEAVKTYLKNDPKLVNQRDENGYSALLAAVSYSHLELIKELVETFGADKKITDGDGDGCFHLAEDVETCELLVSLDFVLDQRNDEGKLAIESHWIQGNDEIVEYLESLTKDVEWTKYEEERAMWALEGVADSQTLETLQYLLNEAESSGQLESIEAESSGQLESILKGDHALETIPEE